MQRPENSSSSPPQGLCFLKSISLFIYFVWRKRERKEGREWERSVPRWKWGCLWGVGLAFLLSLLPRSPGLGGPQASRWFCPFSSHCMSSEVTHVCHHIWFYNLSIIYLLLGACMRGDQRTACWAYVLSFCRCSGKLTQVIRLMWQVLLQAETVLPSSCPLSLCLCLLIAFSLFSFHVVLPTV